MEGSVGIWGTCQHQEEQPETRRGHWEVSRLVCCDSGRLGCFWEPRVLGDWGFETPTLVQLTVPSSVRVPLFSH